MIRAVTITQNWQKAQQNVPLGGQAQSTRCEAQRAEHRATVRVLLYLNCSFVIALVIQNNHINPTTSQMLTQTLQHCINHDPEWLRRNGISFLRMRKQILKKKEWKPCDQASCLHSAQTPSYLVCCRILKSWKPIHRMCFVNATKCLYIITKPSWCHSQLSISIWTAQKCSLETFQPFHCKRHRSKTSRDDQVTTHTLHTKKNPLQIKEKKVHVLTNVFT